MSKKTFTAAPKPKQPTAEQITAFEQGGAGHDTPKNARIQEPENVQTPKPEKSGTQERKNVRNAAEPIKKLGLDIPVGSHSRFKAACSAMGLKMTAEILDFIERRTAELEKEAGIKR